MMLSATDSLIRVALPGCDDAAEIRWSDGNWFLEDGRPVQVDFASPAAEFQKWAERFAAVPAAAGPGPALYGGRAGQRHALAAPLTVN